MTLWEKGIQIYDSYLEEVVIDKNTVYCYFDEDSGECLKIQKHYMDNNIDISYCSDEVNFYDECFGFEGVQELLGNDLENAIEEKIAEKYKKKLKLKDIIMKGVK